MNENKMTKSFKMNMASNRLNDFQESMKEKNEK